MTIWNAVKRILNFALDKDERLWNVPDNAGMLSFVNGIIGEGPNTGIKGSRFALGEISGAIAFVSPRGPHWDLLKPSL